MCFSLLCALFGDRVRTLAPDFPESFHLVGVSFHLVPPLALMQKAGTGLGSFDWVGNEACFAGPISARSIAPRAVQGPILV